MSGHSKWANIKRKKEVNDKQKANQFTKLSRLITLAISEGGGITDPENNVRLRLIIDKAKSYNMPKANVDRAIERAKGADRTVLKEIVYEAFAPHGVAFVIQTTTDNQNRTFSEIRSLLEQREGKLGGPGSVMYMFQKCGLVMIKKVNIGEEQALALVSQLSAFDIDQDEEYWYLYIPFEALGHTKSKIGALPFEAEIDYKPQTTIDVSKEAFSTIQGLAEVLEEHDDVQGVFMNAHII